jgi:serine/threonine protein kinase
VVLEVREPDNKALKPGYLTESALAYLAHGMLTAVAFLHGRNVLHRDIKGQNVLLSRDATVKLCDFGVSVRAPPPSQPRTLLLFGLVAIPFCLLLTVEPRISHAPPPC